MSLYTLASYWDYILATLPVLENNIGLRTDIFFIKIQPYNYLIVLSFFMLLFLLFANNLLCNIVGIVYPVMYGITLVNTENNTALISLNKYWVLFAVIILVDGIFSGILRFVPGYNYAKLALIYVLLKNDFYWSNYYYDLVKNYYLYYLPDINKYIYSEYSK